MAGRMARTIYVGNLSRNATEEVVLQVFSQIGACKNCRIINDSATRNPYGFLEFYSNRHASLAIAIMNGRNIIDQEVKVNWASTSTSTMEDRSSHSKVFINGLSPDTSQRDLREAFIPFGKIVNCRIPVDKITGKPKGYGFVSFLKKSDAENAVEKMEGQWLRGHQIKINWASRKPNEGECLRILQGELEDAARMREAWVFHPTLLPLSLSAVKSKLSLEDILIQSSPTNCTVYCGGIVSGLTDQSMRSAFSCFGKIKDIRVFPEKGYSFLRFADHESAAYAILAMNGVAINGYFAKVYWGKEYYKMVYAPVPPFTQSIPLQLWGLYSRNPPPLGQCTTQGWVAPNRKSWEEPESGQPPAGAGWSGPMGQ